MKSSSLAATLVLCTGLATSLAQTTTPTQPKTPISQPSQPKNQPTDRPGGMPSDRMGQPTDKKADMQKMAEVKQEHRDMARAMTGEWTTNVTFRHAANDPPSTSTGRARFEPAMEGRFMREHVEGEIAGEPMRGEGLFGYNTLSKKYESVWVDNHSPAIMYMQGEKKGNNEIEFEGECHNPTTGKEEDIRAVMRFDSNDKMTYEMWGKGSDGAEFKALEVVYTRTGGPRAPGAERPTNVRPGVEPKTTPTTPDRTTPGTPGTPDNPRSPAPPKNEPKR